VFPQDSSKGNNASGRSVEEAVIPNLEKETSTTTAMELIAGSAQKKLLSRIISLTDLFICLIFVRSNKK